MSIDPKFAVTFLPNFQPYGAEDPFPAWVIQDLAGDDRPNWIAEHGPDAIAEVREWAVREIELGGDWQVVGWRDGLAKKVQLPRLARLRHKLSVFTPEDVDPFVYWVQHSTVRYVRQQLDNPDNVLALKPGSVKDAVDWIPVRNIVRVRHEKTTEEES